MTRLHCGARSGGCGRCALRAFSWMLPATAAMPALVHHSPLRLCYAFTAASHLLPVECSIGPTGQLPGFLRPETAQGMFVNFR